MTTDSSAISTVSAQLSALTVLSADACSTFSTVREEDSSISAVAQAGIEESSLPSKKSLKHKVKQPKPDKWHKAKELLEEGKFAQAQPLIQRMHTGAQNHLYKEIVKKLNERGDQPQALSIIKTRVAPDFQPKLYLMTVKAYLAKSKLAEASAIAETMPPGSMKKHALKKIETTKARLKKAHQ